MKTQDNTQNALQSANRLLEKYRQQDATANACGFTSYIDMQVEAFDATAIDYSVLSSLAQKYPPTPQELHLITNLINFITMTNREVAESFADMVNGTQTKDARSANGHFRAEIDSFGNVSLYSYRTKVAYYEKATQTLIFNRTRYSTTTSTKHQSHFYLIERNAYKVSQKATLDHIVQDNDLTRYIATNRYIMEAGESWKGEKFYKVFDQIGKKTICTYKKRHFAARKVAELNEAQALKG